MSVRMSREGHTLFWLMETLHCVNHHSGFDVVAEVSVISGQEFRVISE
jgi:hypothetical protein